MEHLDSERCSESIESDHLTLQMREVRFREGEGPAQITQLVLGKAPVSPSQVRKHSRQCVVLTLQVAPSCFGTKETNGGLEEEGARKIPIAYVFLLSFLGREAGTEGPCADVAGKLMVRTKPQVRLCV